MINHVSHASAAVGTQKIADVRNNRLTSVPEKLLSMSQHARKAARRRTNNRRTFLSMGGEDPSSCPLPLLAII